MRCGTHLGLQLINVCAEAGDFSGLQCDELLCRVRTYQERRRNRVGGEGAHGSEGVTAGSEVEQRYMGPSSEAMRGRRARLGWLSHPVLMHSGSILVGAGELYVYWTRASARLMPDRSAI